MEKDIGAGELNYVEGMRLKPYKREFGFSYACGVFPVCELYDAMRPALKKIIVTESGLANGGVVKLRENASAAGIPFEVDDKTVARIYPKGNVYAVGVFEKRERELRNGADHVMLVNPSDMGNMGTIMRTAVAFGIGDLCVVKPCCDVFDPKTVRASMGAVFRLRIQTFDSFEEYFERCGGETDRDYYPFMLDGEPLGNLRAGDRNVHAGFGEKGHDGRPFSLIFGNEAAGLPESFKNVGRPVRIMHSGDVDSLNLPVAVAIGIYTFAGGKY